MLRNERPYKMLMLMSFWVPNFRRLQGFRLYGLWLSGCGLHVLGFELQVPGMGLGGIIWGGLCT